MIKNLDIKILIINLQKINFINNNSKYLKAKIDMNPWTLQIYRCTIYKILIKSMANYCNRKIIWSLILLIIQKENNN